LGAITIKVGLLLFNRVVMGVFGQVSPSPPFFHMDMRDKTMTVYTRHKTIEEREKLSLIVKEME
jgi:hypothetical protein